MTDRDDDSDDSPDSGEHPAGSTQDPGDDADEPEGEPEDIDDGTPRVTREQLGAFLALAETRKRAAGIIRGKVKPQEVEDFVYQAIAEALDAKRLPCSGRMQAWLDSICRRVVAGHYRKRARRKKYEGKMPAAPVQRDEAGEPVDDPGDAVVDIDPSYDPDADDFQAEGFLFKRWMKDAVADSPRDRETYAIMEEWADAEDHENKTYADIARARGMSKDAVHKRIERLKKDYLPRYKEWRNRFILLLVFGGAVAAFVVLVIGMALRRPRPTTHEPIGPEPAPPASASASGVPTEVLPPPLDDRRNIADPWDGGRLK